MRVLLRPGWSTATRVDLRHQRSARVCERSPIMSYGKREIIIRESAGALLQTNSRKVQSAFLSTPPSALAPSSEVVQVQPGSHILRRTSRKWIESQQSKHARLPVQQPCQKMLKPRILLITPQSQKPHLPVEPRLVRRDYRRGAQRISGLIRELVRQPILAVVRALHHDFGPGCRHIREQTVRIHDP